MNKVKEIFSKNLNQCLKDKKMTASALAKKMSIQKSTVSEWRTNNRFPRSNQLEQLAKILEKPIHWFFEEEHKETQEVRALTPIEVVAEALKELNEAIDNQNFYKRMQSKGFENGRDSNGRYLKNLRIVTEKCQYLEKKCQENDTNFKQVDINNTPFKGIFAKK